MNEIQLIITLAGTLGGLDLLKWLATRKRQGRSDEFKLLREQLEYLQERDKAKEERFDNQTQRLRLYQNAYDELMDKHMKESVQWSKDKADLEIEMAKVRCEDLPCAWRRPPNAHTEPKPKGKTKAQVKGGVV